MKTPFIGIAFIAFVLGTTLTGCVSTPPPPPPRTFAPADYEVAPGQTERGLATWYGEAYRGKTTASGQKFNPDDFTAAHRTLRFGSVVEVRNLKNNRTVLVEITDRGPFGKNRIIDLSEAAAKQLDMITAGVVPVEIRPVRRRAR